MENNDSTGVGAGGVVPVNTTLKPDEASGPKPAPGVASVAARLGGREAKEEDKAEEGAPTASEPNAFDISKLTYDQIQQLKAMLNNTPDRVARQKQNPVIGLRVVRDNVVVDFKNAYLALLDDPENNRQVERHVIPVKFHGDTEFTTIPYKEFMESPRVECEAVKVYSDETSRYEGEVYSKERGAMVEREVKMVTYSFDLRVPGIEELVRIDGKVANA